MEFLSGLKDVLVPTENPTTSKDNLRLAAVLILIFPDKRSILFTKRTENLKQHQGQIAFPGGRFEESDGDLAYTAIRETTEEVGIDQTFIEVIGRLPPLVTTSRHYVYPYVGVVDKEAQIIINPNEVQEYFFAELKNLLDPVNFEKGFFRGMLLPYYKVKEYKIWGVTQQILTEFLTRIRSLE